MSILPPAAPSFLFKKLKIEAFFFAISVIGAGLGTGEVLEGVRAAEKLSLASVSRQLCTKSELSV